MILEKQFIKSIPVGYKEKVLDKLQKFEEQLLECENKIRELPAGYWVRMIKNTNIFNAIRIYVMIGLFFLNISFAL